MKLETVEIKNFRGIAETKLDLWGHDPGQVVTLIGLNESGKTTILEGLSNFVSRDADTLNLIETYYGNYILDVEGADSHVRHRQVGATGVGFYYTGGV